MESTPIQQPLNALQLEILKLFSRDLNNEDLVAIKRLIVKYLAKKATKMADRVWEQNNWTNEDMDRLLDAHDRTPYDPTN